MPVLRVLKRQLPHADIYWWIEATFAPLLEGDPDLTGLFIFRRKGWRTLACGAKFGTPYDLQQGN